MLGVKPGPFFNANLGFIAFILCYKINRVTRSDSIILTKLFESFHFKIKFSSCPGPSGGVSFLVNR